MITANSRNPHRVDTRTSRAPFRNSGAMNLNDIPSGGKVTVHDLNRLIRAKRRRPMDAIEVSAMISIMIGAVVVLAIATGWLP